MLGSSVQNEDASGTTIGTLGVPDSDPLIHKHINSKQSESKQAHTPPFSAIKSLSEYKENSTDAGAKNCTPCSVKVLQPVSTIFFTPPTHVGSYSTPVRSYSYQNFQPIQNVAEVPPPLLSEVKSFFVSMRLYQNAKQNACREATKFFSHYAAIGWKLGGTTPILDWQSAAKKWVLNIRPDNATNQAITKSGAGVLAESPKNYSEPL